MWVFFSVILKAYFNWSPNNGVPKGLSITDKGVFDGWNGQIPLNAHFRDGEIWRMSKYNPKKKRIRNFWQTCKLELQ